MNTSSVDTQAIAEKFYRSHFWREHKEFRVADVASFCKVNRYEAVQAIKEMPASCDHKKVYKRHNDSSVMRTQWRQPLEWDGEHTPRWC